MQKSAVQVQHARIRKGRIASEKYPQFSSVQFSSVSSVAQSCPTL